MGEQMIIKTMRLPQGRDYEWIDDCSVVILSDRLSRLGRTRALAELRLKWWLHRLVSEEP